MQTLRRKLQTGVWLALVALLALALMPTLSQALAHSRGDTSRWAEVCTPQGMKQVLVQGDAETGAPVQAANLSDHCAYCTLASAVAPPPAPLNVTDHGDAGTYVPPLLLHAPYTLYAWRSAQPRGPPAAA